MIRLLIAALLATCLIGHAHAADWNIDKSASELGFSGAYEGEPFSGVFNDFDADIRFDPQALDDAHFDVRINLASADTHSDERDEVLLDGEFFAVKRFPQARFVSSDFGRDGDGNIRARGMLTIRDQTRPVELAVSFTPGSDDAVLQVSTTLQREDFGLGTSKDWAGIAAQVDVHARLHLIRP